VRFTELAGRWQRADEARRFVATPEQCSGMDESLSTGAPVADWLAWARKRIAGFVPTTDGPVGVSKVC
jgi:hypothetical protein